jgi:hypothetical protein
MKKIFFLMLTLLIMSVASMNAQVLIGGDGTGNPDPAAVLELRSSNQGFLLPRVALTSTADPAPLAAFVNGMMVYNTVNHNDVTQGTYYCDGIRWNKVRNSLELIKKSDLSGEVIKLIMDLAETGGTVTNTCPPSVIGSSGTSYAVGDFGIAGCWMIDNSKEGTPSATHYMEGLDGEKAEGLHGYYYTWQQAQSACPPGFSLPTNAQFSLLQAVVTGNISFWNLWRSGTYGGGIVLSYGTWYTLLNGYWWASPFPTAYHMGANISGPHANAGYLWGVRCIMD